MIRFLLSNNQIKNTINNIYKNNRRNSKVAITQLSRVNSTFFFSVFFKHTHYKFNYLCVFIAYNRKYIFHLIITIANIIIAYIAIDVLLNLNPVHILKFQQKKLLNGKLGPKFSHMVNYEHEFEHRDFESFILEHSLVLVFKSHGQNYY
ncbi:hypothetical protein BpHYR1_049552 [Brachionus plicatilis]|uniref:Uncharacterized protein n=1 Tax=Brachionus plicatilis TaxID=10195 RepID=A0A3M7SAP6_BRAPC|nr:hypothetical protein BpHYR1_049552 [Brachionus plicatilis]